jgi:hypothetical protein
LTRRAAGAAESFDHHLLTAGYGQVRRYAPTLLEHSTFVPRASRLLDGGVETLGAMNRNNARKVPERADKFLA